MKSIQKLAVGVAVWLLWTALLSDGSDGLFVPVVLAAAYVILVGSWVHRMEEQRRRLGTSIGLWVIAAPWFAFGAGTHYWFSPSVGIGLGVTSCLSVYLMQTIRRRKTHRRLLTSEHELG